ncbi:MAG: gas vesicle protein GvpG [bacterium]|nr:gas vesicle protein GvpG [bacterium]
MLLVDDILLFPASGILWIFRAVNQAAQEAMAGEAEDIKAELRELYMRLETGMISEDEYDIREKALLDRLETVRPEEE